MSFVRTYIYDFAGVHKGINIAYGGRVHYCNSKRYLIRNLDVDIRYPLDTGSRKRNITKLLTQLAQVSPSS